MKAQEIKISRHTLYGDEMVKCQGYQVRGVLAVHRCLRDRHRWRVVHLRTGFQASGDAVFDTRRKATRFAEVMADRLDFGFDDPKQALKRNKPDTVRSAVVDAHKAAEAA